MDESTKTVLLLGAILTVAGIAYLIAKAQSIEQRLNVRPLVVSSAPSTAKSTASAPEEAPTLNAVTTSFYY